MPVRRWYAIAILAATLALAAASALLVTAEPPAVVRIVLVGDIMLARNVAERIRQARNPRLPFAGLDTLLHSSDFNFGNLESPLAAPEGAIGGHPLIFAAPAQIAEVLREYNFRILSLANNHALDQGPSGLAYTIRRLGENGILTVGAGNHLHQAWQPEIVEVKHSRIGFLAASYASVNDGGKSANQQVARIEDLARLRSQLGTLKTRADLIIVAMHAGAEYTVRPNLAQVAFAHAAIDAGADVVAGSHPHWVQPVERYKGGLIFYSLGNFIFDLDGASRQGLAATLLLAGKHHWWAQLHPVEIEHQCCPRPANAAESQQILSMNATATLMRLR